MKCFKYILGCSIFLSSVIATDSNNQTKGQLLQEGHRYKHEGNFSKAKEFYTLALKKDPSFQAAKSSLQSIEKDLRIQKFQQKLPSQCTKADASDEDLSKCANEFFVYKGVPLSVKMIFDMMPWLSDRGAQVLTLDIENSFNSNRYFEGSDYSIEEKGKWFKVILNDEQDNTTYSYEVVGKTTSGVFVVKTVQSPNDGTGVFIGLIFLKIENQPNFQFIAENTSNVITGKIVGKRLVLKRLEDFAMGDRTHSEVKISGNTVEIKMTPHLENKSVTQILKFESCEE